jgi:hypothetical protein
MKPDRALASYSREQHGGGPGSVGRAKTEGKEEEITKGQPFRLRTTGTKDRMMGLKEMES